MRILYLHQYFVTPAEPGGTRSYQMARRWSADHEVMMITTDRDASNTFRGWRQRDVDGIKVHSCSVPYSNHMSYRERIRAFGSFATRAGQYAASLGGDVVFATSTPLTIAIPGAIASRRLGVPMVFEIRDLWPEMPIAVGALRSRPLIRAARALERFAYRNSSRIVALSPDMAKSVIASGYPRECVRVVPNSADNAEFESAQRGTGAVFSALPQLLDRPFIAYCGTLGELNGVDYLVELAAESLRLGDPLGFLIVGDGKDKSRVEARARELGVLGTNLWLHGPIPKRDVMSVFATAVACCSLFRDIPEMWANSANKFFDSLAAGKPAIINYGGWQADLIGEESCGLVLPPGKPAQAAALLRDFVRDPARLAACAANAKRVALSRFDRDQLSRDLLAVLQDAVSTHARQ